MTAMRVILDGEGCFPEAKVLVEVTAAARLAHGMQSGKSSVCFEIEVEGKKYYAQTSLAMLDMAVSAMKTRDEMEASNEVRH